jgi:ABC-type cobalamin/Fe3+-siderophores transport system ATPase subunit
VRLASVDIRDYRSIFADDAGQSLHLDLADGANTLVGRNNCGKSNVLRAISLALDPHHEVRAEDDTPGPRRFAHPIITLGFAGDATDPSDARVLGAADVFERATGVPPGHTRSSSGEVLLRVSFVPTPDGVRRDETILGAGEPSSAETDERRVLLDNALAELRDAVRFVLISSGESIESVLEGNFREILHSVVRDRLRDEFDTAEQSRRDYIEGIQDRLLHPLRQRLADDVGGMFPEITGIDLSPEVSSIERTLSNVGVSLSDIVATPLAGKGTGVRGGVLVAMLSYLALNATKHMVFAVEEPEAFLHPGAQEDLRDQLDAIAAARGVTLLVTTHSPFTVTTSPRGRVFCLAKDREGRTRLAESAPGDADHARLVGDLVREATLESLLKAATAVPAGTAARVLVEGDGDRTCLDLAATVVGRPDLVADLSIVPTGGTLSMKSQAIVHKAALDIPLLLLVDNDEAGKSVRATLVGNTFKFDKKRVVSYADVFPGDQWRQFPVEAEDLFAPELLDAFVEAHGDSIIDGKRRRPDGAWHYDFNQAAKEVLGQWLAEETRPEHVSRWIELLLLIRTRAGLPASEATAEDIVAAAPEPARGRHHPTIDEGTVLIVSGQHDYARYLQRSALVIDGSHRLPDGFTHVGFYSRGIQPHVPVVLKEYSNLLFDEATVRKLRATGQLLDARIADVIQAAIEADDATAGGNHQVVLLSAEDDTSTILLDGVVKNTKEIRGKPVAWTVKPRPVPLAALAGSPATTDDLDKAIAALGEP